MQSSSRRALSLLPRPSGKFRSEYGTLFHAQIWVSAVTLTADGQPDVTISAHAWVNTVNSPRVFFNGQGILPSQTPAGLKGLRQTELDIIKACIGQLPGVVDDAGSLTCDVTSRWIDELRNRSGLRMGCFEETLCIPC